jgi:hypothetical protein
VHAGCEGIERKRGGGEKGGGGERRGRGWRWGAVRKRAATADGEPQGEVDDDEKREFLFFF